MFSEFPFEWGKMYAVGMITPQCCEECLDNGLTAHVVNINKNFPWGNWNPFGRRLSVGGTNMKRESYKQIFGNFNSLGSKITEDSELQEVFMKFYSGSMSKGELEVSSSKSGQKEA